MLIFFAVNDGVMVRIHSILLLCVWFLFASFALGLLSLLILFTSLVFCCLGPLLWLRIFVCLFC